MADIDIDALKKVCSRIVREGDLDSLTDRTVRRSAEKELGLEQKVLDEQPYKKLVKDTVSEVLESLTKEREQQQDSENSNEVAEDDGAETDNSDENGNDDAAKSTEEKGNSENEDEFSDVVDEEPVPARRSKKRDTSDNAPAPRKRAKTTADSEGGVAKGSAATIANLKSYISKCGLRKTWSKELAGMNGAQQVRHLKKILQDLGMEGRPTLEKCKQIKAKRDLQAELDAMDQDNIIEGGDAVPQAEATRSRRRAASKKVSYTVDHISDSEEGEEFDEGKDNDETGDDSEEDGQGGNSDKDSDQDADEEVQDERSEESDAYTENASESDANDVASSEGEPDSEPEE
ncbi:hypothetical protein H4R20_001879 [Coemansia guatemalensis]|uniref:DEK-C domain-containing protein n=1 Tax=Coemansia guatemalensis TaxID=2761395 RepID=A0A9W8LV85_9FUNG|nr:hypothetical protein H4R20_001879 [Coemansia guatemalensis]